MKVGHIMRKDLKYKEIVKRLTLENFDILKEEYNLNHNVMLGILDYGLHDKDILEDKRKILNKLKYKYQFSLVLKDSKYGIMSDTHIGNVKDSPYYINKSFKLLEQNGIVYGVIWNDDIVAIHSRAKNIEQLEKMYSSKYV